MPALCACVRRNLKCSGPYAAATHVLKFLRLQVGLPTASRYRRRFRARRLLGWLGLGLDCSNICNLIFRLIIALHS